MSTLHKVKAYFGMAPMDDYEDDYYDDDDRAPVRGYRRPREDRFEDEGYARGFEGMGAMGSMGDDRRRDYDEPPAYRGGFDDARFEPRLRTPREFDRTPPRFGGMRGSTAGQDHHAAAEGLQRGAHHR
jgi:cell division inhibitor SepF